MLFSNSEIARYINKNFEPVWVSVAPVPKVIIDFGNGHKVTRTVTGNIATYICTADGYIVDIVPGIYEPTNYLKSIQELDKVAKGAMQESSDLTAYLRSYHSAKLKESNLQTQTSLLATKNRKFSFLAKDTKNNETLRRKKVHSMLSNGLLTKPSKIYPRLYRDVLALDLKDPYMGLKSMLSANYPFQDQ